MARQINKLNPRAVDTLKSSGRHSDGGGLYLSIAKTGGRRWVFLFRWQGKPTEMGLGSAAKGQVSLARARELASEARTLLASGINPLAEKRASHAARDRASTFGEFADRYIEEMSPQWRNAKHRAQWAMTLTRYAAPLRQMELGAINTNDVVAALKPVWSRVPETAERLRGRIEVILDAAKAKGLRAGENPARWRGHLEWLLPKRQRLTRGHHAALPHKDIPAFIEQLRQTEATTALALEFCILTAARSSEVLGAVWKEVDPKTKIWTIPSHRIKAGREHRVPLSPRAMEILKGLHKVKTGRFIFEGSKPEQPLSSMAMAMLLRRLRMGGITVHGFRSSFRDWVWEETEFSHDLAEQALAHALKSKSEAAYRRGDALERRRAMMVDWSNFCGGF